MRMRAETIGIGKPEQSQSQPASHLALALADAMVDLVGQATGHAPIGNGQFSYIRNSYRDRV